MEVLQAELQEVLPRRDGQDLSCAEATTPETLLNTLALHRIASQLLLPGVNIRKTLDTAYTLKRD